MLPDNRTEKHFRSQSYFLKQDGQLIPNSIGRLERIEGDWEALQEEMGSRRPWRRFGASGVPSPRAARPRWCVRSVRKPGTIADSSHSEIDHV
jgi:hypothetical protein